MNLNLNLITNYNDYSANDLKEFYASSGAATNLLSTQVNKITLENQEVFTKQLNQKVFNLFLNASFLTDNSFYGKTTRLVAISTNNFVVQGKPLNANTSNLPPKIFTFSAKEITGNSKANANTKLEGIYGYLVINGEEINIGNNKFDTKNVQGYDDNLNSILRKINGLNNSGVKAEIIDNALFIYAANNQPLNIQDKTYGGKNDRGLGIKLPPNFTESDVLRRFLPPDKIYNGIETKYSQVIKYSSNSVQQIVGAGTNSTTPLYGITGSFYVQDYKIPVNSAGIIDNLNSLANRINALNINIKATVENTVGDNKLVLQSSDLNTEIKVRDETTGGNANGLGISRSGYSDTDNVLAANYLYSENVIVYASAQKQLTKSYNIKNITNNSSATENTPLNLSGTLKINHATIILQPTHTLKDIESLINTLADGVSAKIVEGDLYLQPTNKTFFTLKDNTTGGALQGLGLGVSPYQTSTSSLNVILGKTEVNENTFLEGISGILRINNVDFQIGLKGSTDTLARIKDKINTTAGVGVSATIENNKLNLTSNNGNPISITDLSSGGYVSENGALNFNLFSSNIIAPQKAVIQAGDKILSLNENSSPDGVSGFNLNSLSSNAQAETVQLTLGDNVNNIKNLITNFIVSYNDFKNFTTEKTKITEKNINQNYYFNNQSLIKFINNLDDIFSQAEDSTALTLKDIGVQKFSNSPDTNYTLDKNKLSKQLKTNLQQTLNIFQDKEKGIAVKVSHLLKKFVYGDGVPNVDVRETGKFSLFKEKYDPFSNLVNFQNTYSGFFLNYLQ